MAARKLFLQLGRVGDILNVLPLAWKHWQDTGQKPLFMVAAEFAHVLEAVTYVEPVIFNGLFEDIMKAAYEARGITTDIAFCQIYGRGLINPQKCTSFARESWAQGGAKFPWGTLPLVLDNRNAEREDALCKAVLGDSDRRPVVLLALEGKSSPFPFRVLLAQKLPRILEAEGFRVIDISKLRAERFTDLLGLFEKAHCLVAIDTGHQHLAAACNVPVVSLVTRDPARWHGSPWRPEHVARYYYDEFPEAVWSVAASCATAREEQPRIVHVWADWRDKEPSEETKRRLEVARKSWANEYALGS